MPSTWSVPLPRSKSEPLAYGSAVTWRRGPLASRNFRLLVSCDVISMTGTAMAQVAIPFAVLRSGGSVSDVGFVIAAALIATTVFLLFGGVLADRLPRLRVMLAANVVQSLAQAGFAALVLTGHAQVWQMMLLSAARGAGIGLYLPASQGLVPQTVPAGLLGPANAIRRAGLNGAQIGGAALGGVVVELAGPGWGLAADAASFAVAALLRAWMRLTVSARTASSTMLGELRQGWREFTSHRWLWAIVVQFSLVNAIFGGAFTVLGPVVADHHLGGAGSWGAIVATESAGAVLGAVVSIRYRPRRLLLAASLTVSLLVLPLFALAWTRSVPLIAIAALVSGAGTEIFEVNWSTALQEQIPLDMLSRISAYDMFGSYTLTPVGSTIAGPVALALGVAAALTGGGIVILASVIAVICVPEVRNLLRRQEPGQEGDRAALPGSGEGLSDLIE
jgi:predicted MFS family arabinose efflux permease